MKIPFKQYWELLSGHIKTQVRRFWLLAFLLFISIVLQVVNPQIVRFFIDTALSSNKTQPLMNAAVLFLGIAIVQQIVTVSAAYVGENVAWTATNALRAEMAKHCLNLDMNYHNNVTPGELIERIDGDVAELSNLFSQFVVRVLGNIVLMFGICVAVFFEDFRLGMGFLVFTLITMLALNRVGGIAIPHQKAVRNASADFFGYLEERLSGTEDVRASGAVDYAILGIYKIMYIVFGHWKKASRMNVVIFGTVTVLFQIGVSAAFLTAYYQFNAGIMTIGTAYLLINYLTLLRRPIRELTQQMENFQNIGAAVERLIELKNIKSKLIDGPGADIPQGALSVSFEDVTFAYNKVDKILKQISFELEPEKILGLLGRTGSGKTTLTRLIFRLYDLTEGNILLGNTIISQAKFKEVRQRVAIVTQDVQLFQASVRDNITFFDDSIPDEKIIEIIHELGISDWYKTLPDGLDTQLKSSGQGLSAGEGQLLALTRVFLRDPGLVILDEASSRLDPATEQMIERAIDKLLIGRTAIIIAHRLGTVDRADKIMILDEGNLVEYGARQALSEDTSSRFYNLLQTGLEEVLT